MRNHLVSRRRVLSLGRHRRLRHEPLEPRQLLAVDLGLVDFRQLANQAPTAGALEYQIQPIRDGVLTAIVGGAGAGASTAMVLSTSGTPIYSGTTRLDYFVSAGQTYTLDVTGLSGNANVTVANLVQLLDGNTTLLAYDTAGDDSIEAWAASPRKLTIDGVTYDSTMIVDTVSDIEFVPADNSGGTDTAIVNGSTESETFAYFADSGTVSIDGDSFTAAFTGVENMVLRAGGGMDVLNAEDSSGTDLLQASPGNITFSGPERTLRAKGFDMAEIYSVNGGEDTASLYDSSGDDTFRATPDYAVLKGAGYRHIVQGFTYVNAYAKSGGHDVAILEGSTGVDSLSMTPELTEFWSNDGFQYRAKYFDEVYATGGGGYDQARMYASNGDDHLAASGNHAQISDAALTYVLYAESYDKVTAKAASSTNTQTVTPPLDFQLALIGPWS